MRNIIRHAKASEISIGCQRTADRVVLTIQDNGSGFTLPEDWLALAQQGHFGLVGIRERTEAIGGQVHIDSHPGKGTRIRISVPA
jgi:signal transduction histidine kinase